MAAAAVASVIPAAAHLPRGFSLVPGSDREVRLCCPVTAGRRIEVSILSPRPGARVPPRVSVTGWLPPERDREGSKLGGGSMIFYSGADLPDCCLQSTPDNATLWVGTGAVALTAREGAVLLDVLVPMGLRAEAV